MSPRSLLFSVIVAALAVNAQDPGNKFPEVKLADKRFPTPADLPYKVDTDVGLERGLQYGYNICNSTTQNQESGCQTSYFNSIEDFCLWGPHAPDSVVGDTEGEMVAWCSQPKHGTRLIPAGTITGLQWMKTPDYVQLVGFIDQTKINVKEGDSGGEMDPHGADNRGNPMGGVLYSDAFSGQAQQVIEWHNFLGNDFFCLKACDPKGPDAARFCEHRFDRIGCKYNAPNAAQDGVFEACEGENQDFPGIYTENGEVKTYTQPDEKLGAISTMPYEPRVPASSKCSTFTSAQLFTALPSAASSAAPTTTAGAGTGTTGAAGTTRATTTPPRPTSSGAANNDETESNGASSLAVTGISLMGVIVSALLLA